MGTALGIIALVILLIGLTYIESRRLQKGGRCPTCGKWRNAS